MSVRIETTQLAHAVSRRPFAYVVSADNQQPHLRAVVVAATGEWFVMRVGSRTAENVATSSTVTLLWPPLPPSDCHERFDDHSVIADCRAVAEQHEHSYELRATPLTAVWHRPAR